MSQNELYQDAKYGQACVSHVTHLDGVNTEQFTYASQLKAYLTKEIFIMKE